jgi:hypothetical protein
MSTGVEDIVEIRHQATTDEDIAHWEDFLCVVVTAMFEACNSVILS